MNKLSDFWAWFCENWGILSLVAVALLFVASVVWLACHESSRAADLNKKGFVHVNYKGTMIWVRADEVPKLYAPDIEASK